MAIIAIVNQKGGVGKTTTAVTLAHGLALEGRRVLLVDLDAQGNVADILGLQKAGGLYRLLIDEAGPDAITPSGREGLDVILGDKTTVQAKTILVGMPFREQRLKNALEDAGAADYGAVFLDVAPGADILQLSALVACTHFMIPVSLSHLAVVGVVDILGTVASLQKVGAYQGDFLGILPTMLDRVTKESHDQLTVMADRFMGLVWPPIPTDIKAREAPGRGLTLWEYAPDSRAITGAKMNGSTTAGGYAAVLKRLMEEVGL